VICAPFLPHCVWSAVLAAQNLDVLDIGEGGKKIEEGRCPDWPSPILRRGHGFCHWSFSTHPQNHYHFYRIVSPLHTFNEHQAGQGQGGHLDFEKGIFSTESFGSEDYLGFLWQKKLCAHLLRFKSGSLWDTHDLLLFI